MNKAVAYIRVSTEEQTDGHSMDNQVDQVNMYCKLYKLELVDIIKDEGISGRKTINRPGFNSLMGMVKAKAVNHVISLSFTRFSRNTMDLLESIDIMTKNDVSFHSIDEKINTDGAIGKFLITLFAGLSQFESDQIGDRTRSVKRFCKENMRTYTRPVMGFDNKFEVDENGNKKNGKLIPNEKELITIREILTLKKKGSSPYKVANYLNLINAPTKRGGKWYPSTIRDIFKNSIYKIMKIV